MIQCKTCGTQLEEGAVFCTNCGTKIESAPEFTYGQPNNTAGDVAPMSSVSAVPESPKRPKKKPVFALVAALLVVVVAGCIFAFTKLGSKDSKMTSSPDVYLKDTLQSNIVKSIDSFADSYDEMLKSLGTSSSVTNQAYDIEVKYELSEMLTSTLSSYTGMNLSDVAANISYVLADQKMSALMSVAANGSDLITLDMFGDLANMVVYERIPAFSSSYLKVDMEAMMEQSYDILDTDISGLLSVSPITAADYPSSKEIKELTTAVTDALLSLLDGNVVLEEKASVTANGVTGTYNKFTASITEGQMSKAALDIIDAVYKSEELYDLIDELFMNSGVDFDSAVAEFKSELDVNNTKKVLDYIVYLDGNGNVTGEEFIIDDSNSLGYYIAKNGSDRGIAAWFKSEGTDILRADGKYTDKDGVKNGEITLSISDTSMYPLDAMSSFNISCTFKDVKSTDDVTNGTFIFSTNQLPGSSLTLALTGGKSKQVIELSANYMSMDLGKIILTFADKGTGTVTPMDTSAAIYDITDESAINSYLEEIDIEAFLDDLSSKLGIDLYSLLDLF